MLVNRSVIMITWATSTAFLGHLSCINMTKECYQISFSQCGRVVSREAFLYEKSTNVPAFFGTNQSAVMFFSETLNLRLTNIVVTRYYGFAIIAANPYGAPLFQRLQIFDSFGGPLCSRLVDSNHARGNYTCYGSGVLVYTHNTLIVTTILRHALLS